ncbi:MAG TPA: hypothetical protein VFF79_12990 [Conexibacter sp.]|jgi:hypothetical protein|nr:hypothetical protein [Conexibacter sp.]
MTLTRPTRENMRRVETLMMEADACYEKAHAAVVEGSSVGARKWFDAAAAALRAARLADPHARFDLQATNG